MKTAGLSSLLRLLFPLLGIVVQVGHARQTAIYMLHNDVRASLSSRRYLTLRKPIRANSLYNNLSTASHQVTALSPARPARHLVSRPLLPFFDILEILENAWEFYCERDQIMEEMLKRGAEFAQRHSVQALACMSGTFLFFDLVARAGIIGNRGEGIIRAIRGSEETQDFLAEKIYQKFTRDGAEIAIKSFRRFRRFGGSSKFAIAFSVGALFSQAAIHTTTMVVKVGIMSFLLLEGLALGGVIGEPGESITEWIEDHKNAKATTSIFLKDVNRFRKAVRKLNFQYLEDFYEAAIDEEKVASVAFVAGSIMAMF
jgi:hypothetical protein